MPWYPLVGVLLGLADHCAAAQWASGHAWCVTDGLHRTDCLEVFFLVPGSLVAGHFLRFRSKQTVSGKARGTVKVSAWVAHPPGIRPCTFASLAAADYT